MSHSSPEATRKWVDLLGGSWNVEIVIDEDRAIYAAWGLGLGTVWSMFNPTTQIQGWKEKGWLGIKVADSLQKTASLRQQPNLTNNAGNTTASGRGGGATGAGSPPEDAVEGPSNVMGNKWQQAGLFAVDGRGTVLWGAKALRADDVMDLDAAAAVLGF